MQPRKQHLIETALTLFNQHGYHATGIDLILAESGVSKATLYKHFRSKEALILAVLQLRHEEVLMKLKENIELAIQNEDSPILAVFDSLDGWFNSETFFGCNFINVTAEYSDPMNPIKVFSAQHKQTIVDLINTYFHEDQKDRANQIDLLIEGAIVMAHTRGMKNAAKMAKEMAKKLILTI